MFWFLGRKACGVLAARPGIKSAPPALEGAVLTTGPPVRSQGGDFHSHRLTVVVKVLVTQLCLPLCDPVDCSPPGSAVLRILQAKILE